MASWRERAEPVAAQPQQGSWRNRAEPVSAPQPQPEQDYGVVDALKNAGARAQVLGSLVPYGYANMYGSLADMITGGESETPVRDWAADSVLSSVETANELPKNQNLARGMESFNQAYEDDGVMAGLSAASDDIGIGDLGLLLTEELPLALIGGGVGGKLASMGANRVARNVASRVATGVGIQSGSVAPSVLSSSVNENLQGATDREEVGPAVQSALKQAGVETAVNAPVGALLPFNIGGPVRNALTQGGAQTVSGVGGAVAGASAVGKEISPGEVALEGLLGGVTVPLDIAVAKVIAARDNNVPVGEVTPEMEAAANSEEAAAVVAEIERMTTEGQLRPEEVAAAIDQITGTTTPQPIDRSTQQGRQQARQTEQELGDLFTQGTDVIPRDQLGLNEEGDMAPTPDAQPVRDLTGRQATPDTYGVRALAARIAQEDGLTLTERDVEAISQELSRNPDADPRQTVRDFSEEGRQSAFDKADVQRRKGQDYQEGRQAIDDEWNALPEQEQARIRAEYAAQGIDPDAAENAFKRAALSEYMREVGDLRADTARENTRAYAQRAFDVADARRRRRDADLRREPAPGRDYRAGAGPEPELSPRMRQELEAAAKRPQAGVNVGQPGMPRDSVDRISTNAVGGLTGEFMPGERPAAPRTDGTGQTFEGNLSDRVNGPRQPALPDESGIGRREQAAREADRQNRFNQMPPNTVRDYLDMARAADRAEAAIDAAGLDPAQAAAAKEQIDNIFNGRGNTARMSIPEATRAIDAVVAEATGRPAPEPEAAARPEPEPEARTRPEPEATTRPEPEPEAAARPEPEPEATTRPEPEPEASTRPEPEPEPEMDDADRSVGDVSGGETGFDSAPRRGSRPEAKEQGEIKSVIDRANGDPARAADILAKEAPTKAQRALASMLAKRLRQWKAAGVPMKLRIGKATTYSGMSKTTGQPRRKANRDVTYDLEVDISISRDIGQAYEVLLHELTHGATQIATALARKGNTGDAKLTKAHKDLVNLYRFINNKHKAAVNKMKRGEGKLSEAEGNLARTNNNAFDSEDELIAWGMTDRNFQRFLEETPYAYGGSMWSRFVNSIREMLGLPAGQETALSELLRIVQELNQTDAQKLRNLYQKEVDRTRSLSQNDEVTLTENMAVNNDADGASKDPEFKPNKIMQAIRGITDGEAREFSFAAERISAMIQTLREATGGVRAENRTTKGNIMVDAWRSVFASLDGDMRVMAGRFKSKTLNSIPDMFHATAGKASGTARSFDEDVQARNPRLDQVDKIVSAMRDGGIKSKEQFAQVIKLVENPRAMRRGALGKAATDIEKFFKDELQYLRDAGVDVGEVPDGYFPREMDSGKVRAEAERFVTQAKKAYRESGLSEEAATEAATAYWESIVYGVSGKPGFSPRGGQTPSFVQSRVFTKAAAKHLEEFRVTDIDAVLGQYTMRATRRAEIAKRFGDNWSEWDAIEAKIREEDPDAAQILPALRDMVAMSAGVNLHNMNHSWRTSLSMLRTFGTLATLPKAAMASLGELVMAPMRGATGSIPGDMGAQLANIWTHIYNTSRTFTGMGRNEKLQAAFEMAEDLGIIAGTGHNSLMAARFAGGDPVGRFQSDVLASFFRRNQLEHLTNYTRVTSMQNGQVFLRRLAAQTDGGKQSAEVFLRELGIPAGKEKAFSAWLMKQDAGMPTAASATGEFAKEYQTALQRFVDQTVMRPSQSTRPKWASHPLGVVVFQLQAFGYAFQKNVINRQARIIKELDGVDKLAYSVSMLSGMAILVGMQGMFRYLRDEMYNDEINDRKTNGAFIEGAISQAGLFGVADPYLQSLTGVRYQKSVSSMFLGPSLGGLASSIDALLAVQLNNSDNTNTAERNMAKATYDWLVEPALQMALTYSPAGPVSGPLASAATIYAIPKGREPFTDVVAGEENRGRAKPPITGVIEWLIGGEEGDKATVRTSTREASGRTATPRESSR